MLLRTKPSQYLHFPSSHLSDPLHIPCYTVPTATALFVNNLRFSFLYIRCTIVVIYFYVQTFFENSDLLQTKAYKLLR